MGLDCLFSKKNTFGDYFGENLKKWTQNRIHAAGHANNAGLHT